MAESAVGVGGLNYDAPTGTAKGAIAECEAERPHVPQIRRVNPRSKAESGSRPLGTRPGCRIFREEVTDEAPVE